MKRLCGSPAGMTCLVASVAAWAGGTTAVPAEPAAKADQSWCKTEPYYTEKLSAILRKLDTDASR